MVTMTTSLLSLFLVAGAGTPNVHSTIHTTVVQNDCYLPWGGTIPDGSSVVAWDVSLALPPAQCHSQVRTCFNGNLTGFYAQPSCRQGQR
jgi:hypothetical protein